VVHGILNGPKKVLTEEVTRKWWKYCNLELSNLYRFLNTRRITGVGGIEPLRCTQYRVGQGLDNTGCVVRPPSGARGVSPCQMILTGSCAHLVFYSMGSEGSFLSDKAAGAWNVPHTHPHTHTCICISEFLDSRCMEVVWLSALCTGRLYPPRDIPETWNIPHTCIYVSEFIDSRYMEVVRLSALRTGRLYPPSDIPETWNVPHTHTQTHSCIYVSAFLDSRCMEVVRLSALRNGRLYPQEITLKREKYHTHTQTNTHTHTHTYIYIIYVSEFLDSRYLEVVRLSALRTGRLYPQEISLKRETYPTQTHTHTHTSTYVSEFLDSRYMEVVSLSALRTGRLYLPRDNPGNHFC